MQDKALKEEKTQVYEIGYLLVSSIPAEKVTSEVSILRETLSKKGAEFIAEEAPELRTLAYTMVKKIGPANHKFDQGYFGWFKFELAKSEIESIKKEFEKNPHVLRILIINTVREATYLGKKAAIANIIKEEVPVAEIQPETVVDIPNIIPAVTPASVEEMDKSIDKMVKGA
ncbi:MAG: 30S ribosomal protein S6 [Patescibacteria group bacterium]